MRKILLISVFACLTACSTEPLPTSEEYTEKKELEIDKIVLSTEPIVDGEPLPEFGTFFSTGTTVIYNYVWLRNTETMTGAIPVQSTWFSPNDLSPPIARTRIELEPPALVSQFSIHNEGGLQRGPYKIIIRAGEKFTASGSTRFFIGMTEKEAEDFLTQEEEILRQREERRKKAEEERQKREEEEAKMGTGETLSQTGSDLPSELSE